jgi:hypothetical protein
MGFLGESSHFEVTVLVKSVTMFRENFQLLEDINIQLLANLGNVMGTIET